MVRVRASVRVRLEPHMVHIMVSAVKGVIAVCCKGLQKSRKSCYMLEKHVPALRRVAVVV